MKILQLCNKPPFPSIDGSTIAITCLTEGFLIHGADVSLLCMNDSKISRENVMPDWAKGKLKYKSVYCRTRPNFYQAIKNLLFSKLPYEIERFYNDSFAKVLIEMLKHERFDVIQLEGLTLATYLPLIRKHSDALVSMRAHNVEYEIRSRGLNYQVNIFIYTYMKIMINRLMKFEHNMLFDYDVLVPITNRDLLKFNELGNLKPSIAIPFAMNPDRIHAAHTGQDYPSIFFLGALDWTPNQGGLIWFINNVWYRMIEKHPHLQFYIAGRNAPNWLKKYFDVKNIVFLGEVPNAYDFMSGKSIMVVPLFYGSGMRVKIIEAMALGKAIITTEMGAEGIAVTDGKHLQIANDPDAFIDKIELLINDPAKYRNQCENAKNFVRENFNNASISRHLVDFYKFQLETK